VVICLESDADLHMVQLMPLPPTVSCFSKIQIGFTFLVPAHPGSPRQRPLNGCVCGTLWNDLPDEIKSIRPTILFNEKLKRTFLASHQLKFGTHRLLIY